MSFDGFIKGLLSGCRPMLCIDGSFLKTFLGGSLLAAIGMDGNNQMFPIAWAVIEDENNDSWEWFLHHLRDCLGGTNDFSWSFRSDEHKVIFFYCKQFLGWSSKHMIDLAIFLKYRQFFIP